MKLQELTARELQQVSGGASSNYSGKSSFTVSGNTDTLLPMNFTWQQGDQYRSYTIEAGRDVHLDLGTNLVKS